jgi:probable F420-dependent oxidoreductase
MRPFRFGVVVSAPSRAEYVAAAREAEALGYDVLLCSDHLELGGRHSSHFMPIPALTAAAMATTRIRVGTSVLNPDLRHPAVLARDAASVDVLSDGRLELGLGAGWAEPEYHMAGLAFDPAPVRVRRLAEYVRVVKGVMAPAPFTFDGEFFAVREMPGEPAPLQAPHPPIMIGGTGPKLLALAGREADIVSINLLKAPDPSDAALAERAVWVRAAAGERFASIELQLPLAAVLPSDDPATVAVRDAAQGRSPILTALASRHAAEALAASPQILAGSVSDMAASLERIRAEHGVSAFMVPMSEMRALAPVIEALARLSR